MKLVAVTRILNEDDIIEAFVRHHRGIVDHHVFLDNGSHDRSCEILHSLKNEGMPITLLRVRSVWSEEVNHLTLLHRYAASALTADWVVPLDADEFLDGRSSARNFRDFLSALPDQTNAIQLRVVNYPSLYSEDKQEPIVPKRLVWRIAEDHENYKIIVRGGPLAGRIVIDAGSHKAWLDTQIIDAATESDFQLAHYPRRSAWQEIAKSSIGRLKVVAAGKVASEAGHGMHYKPLMDILKDRPRHIFEFPDFMEGSRSDLGLRHDPIDYLGTKLLYTIDEDPKYKAVRCLAAYVEELASQHGRLIDENTSVRALMQIWIFQMQLVF